MTPPPPRSSPPSSAGRGVAVTRRARFASAGRLVLAGLVLAALALGTAPASAQSAFNFLDKSGPPSTVVTSNEITVAGLGTSVSVTARFSFCRFLAPDRVTRSTAGATCTLVKNGTDVSGSRTTVANGDKVKIKVTSNSAVGGQAQVRVFIGTGSDWFTVTTVQAADTSPDSFNFLDKSGPPSTVVTSDEITVAGLGTSVSVTARFSFCRFVASDGVTHTTTGAACTLVKNGTDVSGASTTVANGDKVKIKVTSNSAVGGQAQVRVYIGTGTGRQSDWFTVTTVDTTPHAFNFLNKSGPPSTVVTSDEITVAGLGTSVSVTAQLRFCRFVASDGVTQTTTGAACTLVKNGTDVSGSSTTVANGDKVKIKVTSNSAVGGKAQVRVDIGTGLFSSAWFTVTTAQAADTTPDLFRFTDQSNVAPSTVVTSNEVTVAGVDGSVTARFSSCRFVASDGVTQTTTGTACTLVKNGTDVSGSSTTVANGDKVKIKVTSNSAVGGKAQVRVSIGTGLFSFAWFTVTTRAADTTPDPFSFTRQSYEPPSTVVTSNEITVAGVETSVTATISICRFEAPVTLAQTTTGAACTLVKNGTDVSGSSTTVANGDKIAVKVTSHGSHLGRAVVRVSIGTGTTRSSWFTVATWDPMDTTPDFFSFARQFDVAPSTVVTSNEITVAGVDGSVTARFNFCRFEAPVTGARTTTGAACTLVKNGTDVSGSSTTVANGDRIAVKVTSNSAGSGGALVKVDIGTGGYSYSWFIVTTRPTVPAPVDTTPDPFSFTRQSDAAPGTVVTSNEITVAGVDGSVTARIGTCRFGVARTTDAACTLVKNGADVSGSSTTVANGDKIAVKVTSDSVGSGSVEAIVGIGPGPYSTSVFVVTTRPTVTLSLSSTSISESGGVSRVTATLSGVSSAAVTVTVSATPVAPAMSGDFALSSATTLTIAAGSMRSWGKVTIAAVDNSDDEPNKEVTVSGTASGGNGVAAPSSRTLTLIDDEGAPTVTLALSPTSISETGGVSTVTATLDRAASAATTVTVTAAAGTNAAAGDFSLSSANTLTIASGSTTSTGAVTVTARGNAVDAPDKSVTVSGTASGGGGVANPSSVTLTITDDEDLPEVTLALSPSSIDEHDGTNPGSSTVTATLDRASSEAVTLTVSASPGSGTDFTLSSANTLTIAAGQTASAGTVTITAVNDTTDAPNKSVTVSATAAGGNGVAAPSSVALTITDDEALPTVTLALSPASISENGGVSTVTAELSGASSEAVTVTVGTAAGPGVVAADLSLSSATTLTIAAGETTSTGAVTVTANDNAVDAPDKQVMVMGAVSGGNGVAPPSGATLTLTDDDTAGFAVSPSTSASLRLRTTESGGTATFTVKPASEPTGNVVLGVASSDTTEGTVSPSSLTFTAMTWNTAQTVTLTGVDDAPTNPVDGDTDYTVTLMVNTASTLDAGYDALSAVTVYAVNADNEHGLNVGSVTGRATEAGGTATFTVALLTQPSDAVTVSVASRDTSEGAASPSSLTFAATAWSTAQTVTVTGANDTIDDGEVTWAVRLDPSSGDADYNGLANVDVSVTTTDDDAAPGVTLSLSPSSISENGGDSTVSATLSHPSSAATTVTVTAVTGFTTVGSDATIVIAAGATANATDTVTIRAVNNTKDEPDRTATVTATVTNDRATADGTTMAVSGASLTITDDDAAPNAELSLNPASVSENGGTSAVSATLSHPSSAATTVTVTAASGSLYTVGSDATIVIAAGSTANATDTAAIAAVDNAKDEPDRTATVTATLTNSQGAGTASGATLTLTDDDAAPGVTLTASPSSISENGGVSTVSATLTHPSSAATTVTVTPVSGSYSVGSDATITIAAGETANTTDTVAIAAVDNDVDAADSDVTVTGTASNSQGAGTVSGASLTITDDDTAGFAVSPPPSASSRLRTTESGGTAEFTVKPASEPTGNVVLGVASSDTTEGTVSPSTLTFTAMTWNTARTVTLTGVDDAPLNPADGDTDYTVTLMVNTASTVDANYDALSAVTVYAVNADNEYGLNVGSVTGQATEAGGTATFTVALNTQPSAAVTVSVTSRDTSEGAASPSSLTFAATAWDTAQTVTVTGANDAIDDGEVTWAVRLDPSSGDADYNGLANVDVSVTTTDDDGAPGVTLTATPSSISENGGVATVTAMLSRASGAATTVTVTPVSGFYTVGSDTTIVIAAGATANATDTATIAAANDDVHQGVGGRSTAVTATIANDRATADGTTMAVSGGALALTDDEMLPEVTLALSPTSISESGGVSTVTAKLSHPSSEAVTVTVAAAEVSPALPADFDLSTATTLTIAAGQTASSGAVTVTANGNAVDAPDKSVTVSGTVSGGHGVSAPTSVTLTLTDDEDTPTVALVLSPSSISETGGVSSVTATLSHPSSAAVTVTVAAAEVSPALPADFDLSTARTLTIASGSTTSTGAVTVTANGNAVDAPNKSVTVSATVAGGDGAANPSDATLTITDDDGAPGVTLVLTPSTIDEGGTANTVSTVTATLSHPSSAATTVTVSASGSGFTLSSTRTLTIAAGSTASAGTVTVTAADDATDAPDKSVTVSGSASNDQGVVQPSDVTLTITDDDAAPTAALSVASSPIPENGGSTTVRATLSHPSSAATTVTVTALANAYSVAPGSGATIAISAGSTTSADTATITAVDNDKDAADNTVTVAGTAVNSQGAVTVTGASLTITDDDTAGFDVSPSTSASSRLRTTESGGQATFTVKPATEPTGDVVLGVASSDATEGTVSPSTLTFTTTDWNTAQTVTLTGVDDAPLNPVDGNQDYTVTLMVNTASTVDAKYDGLAAVTVYAVNADNEYGLALVPANGVTGQATEAGGKATFTVALTTQPSAAVTVSVSSRDTSEGRASPSSLTFTASDWGTARTVTVTGVDDDIDDGDVAWTVRLRTSSGGDANYDGLDDENVSVTTTDDDGAPTATLVLTPSTIDEGGTANVTTVTARLNRASSAATTVTVSAAPGTNAVPGDYALSAATTLTIAAGSTTSSGTVTIAAVDDKVAAADKEVTVSGTAANDRATADSATVSVTGATLTIADDDEKGFAFAPAEFLEVTEGGAAVAYTVKLTSEPVGEVAVAVAAGNTFLSVSPTELTFGAADWNTARTVTVTARDDGNDDAESSSVSHKASGGGYDGVSGSLPVSVKGETRITLGGNSETRTHDLVIEGRKVEVTVGDGVPSGIVVDFAGVKEAVAAATTITMTISRNVPAATVARAAGDGFNLGPEESRRVVDIDVSPAPSSGLRICLPVEPEVVAGARDAARLRLLRYDGSVWAAVAGYKYEAAPGRVCAPRVTEFSPFATGYTDTRPEFDFTLTALVFTVDEAIDPVELREAKGGDETRHELGPAPLVLPPGLSFDEGRRTLSGTPTEEFEETRYTWTATDRDGHTVSLPFTIEVIPALALARERLKAINVSVLPEVSRAMWGSVVEAVTGRLEGSGPGGGTMDTVAEALRAQEGTQDDEGLSWRKALEGRTFAVGLGGGEDGEGGVGGGGPGGLVAWGGGSRRSLSLDKAALAWSGDVFSAHMGVDGPLWEGLRGGLAATWSESSIEYTDRSGEAAIEGVHGSRMTAVHPYLGWSGPGGSLLWGALGYGWGKIEIVDAEVVERFGVQKGDSKFLGAALGGSVPVLSGDGPALALKGSGEATRYSVADNGEAIAAVSVQTRRLRLTAEGSLAYALELGGTLTPSLELGGRWDGGDGETGVGLELGGGLEWALPSSGLVVSARGRTLAVPAGDAKEWGASGSARLSPGSGGRGLSFELAPSWGAPESGLGRLWDEVAVGRVASSDGDPASARLETELGYGFGLWDGAGLLTPYSGFGYEKGGARRYRLGLRLGLGGALDLGLEADRRESAADPEHGIGLDLRMTW